jgi:hypothetical protein
MLEFYMDQHVESAVTEGLRNRGIRVLTAQEDDTSQASDDELLSRATSLGRILFTQDKDFLRIGPEWQADGRGFAGIVYSPQQQRTVRQVIDYLELVANAMSSDEMRNQVDYVPNS